ncbi:MAG: thermonuclease family protein [Myxococcaceae bacterium]|nr:thermonuclease family protein [Myxococcaceae bacterium]MCI0672836.1 thermonuclease family protein [Myxococcaceae bacterium]
MGSRALRALWILALLHLGCGGESLECGPPRGVVAEVVDGDTVRLEDGHVVRYLLVDTPEVGKAGEECLGTEARELNRMLVEGREVSLSYGEACEDRYGRLLAYVSVSGREVNALLVERGLGCVLFIPPAGSAQRAAYEALEEQAREARRGLWGACSPSPCR